jgi:hypothetical protein
MMSGLILGTQQLRNDIDTYSRPLVEDLNVLSYNDGVQVLDEHKREYFQLKAILIMTEYFQLKAILIMTVSDSPEACNLSVESKKVACGCPHYFRETDSQYLSESQKTVYMGHRCCIPIKHQFQNMNDQFNGNTEKRCPPPHLICHEVYEMVKDVHIILLKQKRTDKNTEEDNMWKK